MSNWISADKHKYSPPEANVIKYINSPIPIVLITHFDDYAFNDDLLAVKDWIAADFVEYTWGYEITETHIFGKNTDKFKWRFNSPEWDKFDNWVKENPPRLYLKRELLAKDATDWLVSCTYPCYYSPYRLETREEFNARKIELMHYWGRSSEYRVRFQSKAYVEPGVTLVDNLYYLQGYLNEGTHEHIWVSAQIPHFARIPLEQVLEINNWSKLSLSLKGCGYRCFRDSESPINSVMVLEDSGIDFPFKWIHGHNCIMYKGDDPIPAIKEALQRDDLYDIYVRGMENIENYRQPTFNQHFEELIKKAV